jgi:hypothetical protein
MRNERNSSQSRPSLIRNGMTIKHRQGTEMSGKSHAIQLSTSVLVLAAGACLALAGCGGGDSPSAAASGGSGTSAAVSGGSNSAGCAAFATAYKKFLAGYASPETETGTDETPLRTLSDAVAKITASGQLEQDLADLGIDAGLIATGETEGGHTTPPSAFYSDLQAVWKDCGTTFTQPPASLVREG